jgi:hypothetical protein
MAENQVYLIKSGQNSFVEETEAVVGISGGKVGIGTTVPESDFHVAGNAQIDGNLTVKGNFTTVDSTTVQVDDKNIELGVVDSPTDFTADGGGITLKGSTDKTITWQSDNGAWNFSEDISVSGSGNFSQGLYVDGNSVLTGSAADLGKWEEGAGSEIFYNDGDVGVGTSDPAYTLDIVGSGNFSQGLYVDGNSVLTGSADDLSKWTEGSSSEVFYKDGNVGVGTSTPSNQFEVVGDSLFNGNLNVGSTFSVSNNGSIGGTLPTSAGQVVTWDGLRWKPANPTAGGGASSEVPVAFVQALASGQSDHTINFIQTYDSVPAISTDLQIDGDGAIIPYAISNIDTSGYTISFAKALPNNNYKIHTNFGGRDVYWTTGELGSINYSGGDVDIQNSLAVGANLTVQGSPVLTGSAADLGKWEEGAGSKIYYTDGNVGIGLNNPAYGLHVNGTIYNENGGINVANKFHVSTLGAVGGQSPDFNEVIKWDGTKWIAGSAPGGGEASSSEVPSAFNTWLNQGSAIQAITFVDAPEGGYQSIPSISTDVEIVEGDIIPYAISGVSTTGYYAVFSDPIPTANNYKIHTTFGGKEVYWQTGAGGNSIYYNGDSVNVDDLVVGGNLTVNGTQTIVNTQTVEIEDHNLLIAANTGYNQLTAEYPGAGGAYAGILWGTGDAGAASPVSLTYQSNKGFAFEGGNLEIVDTSGATITLNRNDTAISVGDLFGGIDFYDVDGGGSSAGITSAIRSYSESSVGASNLRFYTSTSSGGSRQALTEAMRIDSAGNVGIGTSSPTSISGYTGATLDNSTNGSFIDLQSNGVTAFRFLTNGSVNNIESRTETPIVFLLNSQDHTNMVEAMRIKPNGNIGIGTTNPAQKLHVYDSGSSAFAPNAFIAGTTADVMRLGFDSGGARANIVSGRDSVTSGATNSYMAFETRQTGGGITEAMRIDSTGNVGIGTANAVSRFHVNTASSGDEALRLQNAGGVERVRVELGLGTAQIIGDNSLFTIRSTDGSLAFNTSLNERMRIDSAGNVGIGTTSPVTKLQVNTFTDVTSTTVTCISGQNTISLSEDLTSKLSAGDTIRFNNQNTGDISNKEYEVDSITSNLLTLTQNLSFSASLYISKSQSTLNVESGNVGIGTANPAEKLTIVGDILIDNNTDSTLYLGKGAEGVDGVTKIKCTQTGTDTDELGLSFFVHGSSAGTTPASEAMRIEHNGNVGIGTTDPGRKLEVLQNTSNWISWFEHSGTTPYGINLLFSNSTSSSRTFMQGSNSDGQKFRIFSNGDIQNTNNSYGQLSDVRLKENVVNATPKLDDLNKVRIVNFNFKGDNLKQIGVVAQELEQIFPGLVDDIPDYDEDDNLLETATKSVKYSVFVPMMIKAIQEQQTIIEDLKSQNESQQSTISDLVSRIETLENK